MISVGNNEAIICKGDFKPATLYKGDIKIAGATEQTFTGSDISIERTYKAPIIVEMTGKTEQNGTPNPDYPQPIVSAKGSIVSANQDGTESNSVQSAYPLYTGDKWLVGNKYVLDKAVYEFTGNEIFQEWAFGYQVAIGSKNVGAIRLPTPCTHFIGTDKVTTIINSVAQSYHLIYFNVDFTVYPSANDFKSFFASQYTEGTPVTIVYQRATPLEIADTQQLKSHPRYTHITTVADEGCLVPDVTAKVKAY